MLNIKQVFKLFKENFGVGVKCSIGDFITFS